MGVFVFLQDLLPQVGLGGVVPLGLAGVAGVVVAVVAGNPLGQLFVGETVGEAGQEVQRKTAAVAGVVLAVEIIPVGGNAGLLAELGDAAAVRRKTDRVRVTGFGQLHIGVDVVLLFQCVFPTGSVVEIHIDLQVAHLGFQFGVGGEGGVELVLQRALVMVLGVFPGGAHITPKQRNHRCAAHHAENESTAHQTEPVKLQLDVGAGGIDQHLDAQHDEQNRGKFGDGKQIEMGDKLLDEQQHPGGNEQQGEGEASHPPHLFGGSGGRLFGFFHFVYLTLFYTVCIIFRPRGGRGAGGRPPAAGGDAGPAATHRRR